MCDNRLIVITTGVGLLHGSHFSKLSAILCGRMSNGLTRLKVELSGHIKMYGVYGVFIKTICSKQLYNKLKSLFSICFCTIDHHPHSKKGPGLSLNSQKPRIFTGMRRLIFDHCSLSLFCPLGLSLQLSCLHLCSKGVVMRCDFTSASEPSTVCTLFAPKIAGHCRLI